MKNYLTIAILFITGCFTTLNATTWQIDYSGFNVNAQLFVTEGDAVTTFEGFTGHYISAITGQRNGVSITGLQAAGDATVGYTTSTDNRWLFNNVILTGADFDLWGILFNTSDGGSYNLYKENGGYIDGTYGQNKYSYTLTPVSYISNPFTPTEQPPVSSVPDASSTALLMGAGMIGLIGMKRKFSTV